MEHTTLNKMCIRDRYQVKMKNYKRIPIAEGLYLSLIHIFRVSMASMNYHLLQKMG